MAINSTEVLAHLQKQFPGQLVLYVNDVAKVLGRSEKAVANLIARDNLPFSVKKVGGLRCVDIFNIADWLAGDEEAPESPVASGVGKGTKHTRPGKAKQSRPSVSPPSVQSPGLFTQAIMGMRHDQVAHLQRFIGALQDPEAASFMREVLDKLSYSEELETSYLCTIREVSPRHKDRRCKTETVHFCTEEKACAHLMRKLRATLALKRPRESEFQFELKHLNVEMFSASVMGRALVVFSDRLGLKGQQAIDTNAVY